MAACSEAGGVSAAGRRASSACSTRSRYPATRSAKEDIKRLHVGAARRGAASLAREPRECQNGLGATSTSSSRTMRRIKTSAGNVPKETSRMIAPASANASRRDAEAYQERILPAVSRTFALTIPQLEPRLRTVIANAYLLCRIADTIEDEQSLVGDVKQQFHDRFTRVVGSTEDPASFARDLAPLLRGNTLAAQRESLARCIRIMCTGMPSFERRASTAGLADMREMDRYCYYVAGVVGQTLTDLFCDYSPRIAEKRDEMASLDVSFGQGLQMTNILKDFWEDRERGVCWLPHDLFARAGVELQDI